jgi:hypothetical protein
MSERDSICAAEEKPEEWRSIVGYEAKYEVSSKGRVRSLVNCNEMPRREPRLLKQYGNRGYRLVQLSKHNRVKAFQVHRLVLQAFVGNPASAIHQAAHNDGNPANNRVENLRWATPKENSADRFGHGTIRIGTAHRGAKLTAEMAALAIQLRLTGTPCRVIAKQFHVASSVIERLVNGETYPDVPRPSSYPPSRSIAHKFTAAEIQEAIAMRLAGHSSAEIADRFGSSRSRANAILAKHMPEVSVQ